MYYAMYLVGFALMMALNLFTHDRYHIPRGRAVAYTLVTYVYGVVGAMLMGRLYSAVCAARGGSEVSRVAIFGAVMFTPLLLLATLCVEKRACAARDKKRLQRARGKKRGAPTVSVRDTMDMLTPGIFIILTCAKLGCAFEGCCYGAPGRWGVYSARAGTTVFPVQLFEAATMCLILLLCGVVKRAPVFRRGMAYPLTAALYAAARFFWEYKRYYPDSMRRLVFGLTMWQVCSLIVFAVSVVSAVILLVWGERRPAAR